MSLSPSEGRPVDLEPAAEKGEKIAWRQVSWPQLVFTTATVMLIFFTLTVEHYLLGAISRRFLGLWFANVKPATVTPSIVTEFRSEQDYAWYSAGYFLTNMSMLPVYGQLYGEFSVKIVYASAMAVFTTGTVLCAFSRSSKMLMAARLVCGLGGGGLYLGSILIAGLVVEGKTRSIYIALISSVDGISSIVGPTLGGHLASSYAGWRACFYVTLGMSWNRRQLCRIQTVTAKLIAVTGLSVTSLILAALLPHLPQPELQIQLRFIQKIAKVDIVGFTLMVCSFACLLTALNWAVVVHPWKHPKVWGCLLGAGLMLCLYIVIQVVRGEKAPIPCRILRQRTVLASGALMLTLAMSTSIQTYHLPSYFQVVRGLNPEISGQRILAFMGAVLFTPLLSGVIISWTGRYVLFSYMGSIITTVGAVLVASLGQHSDHSQVMGFLFLAGFGIGLCNLIPYTSVQCTLDKEDIVIGSALCTLLNSMGSMLGVTVAQVVFTVFSMDKLSQIEGINAREVLKRGPYRGVEMLSGETKYRAMEAFASATEKAFLIPVVLGVLCILYCCIMERKRLRH